MSVRRFDAVVVGGGTAGAATAWALAGKGLSVALVEARALSEAGARYVVGMPGWVFDALGVPRPAEPELIEAGARTHFATLAGDTVFVLEARDNPMWTLDGSRLVDRLHGLVRDQGVTTFEGARLGDVACRGPRPVSVQVKTREGDAVRLEAPLFVDATGIAQALLRRVPALTADCPAPGRRDYCSAVALSCPVTGPGGALSFLERRGAHPGEAVNWFGLEGGYSTVLLQIDARLSHAHVVIGVTAGRPYRTATEVFDDLRRREPWLGPRASGGVRLIPLRRPYERLAGPGLALVGDSGNMVYSAHASGIGMGLVAARLLADAVTGHADPGGEAATWAYSAAFHRRLGPRLGGMDVLRRLFRSLTGAEADGLLAAGFLAPGATATGLALHEPVPSLGDAAWMARAFVRNPALGAKVAGAAVRIPGVMACHRRYPVTPDRRLLATWAGATARLAGVEPDVR